MEITVIAVFKAFALPPTGFLFLALTGLLLRSRRGGKGLLYIGLIGLFLFSVPAFVNVMARIWENVPAMQSDQIGNFRPQAIVVLGGGIKYSRGEVVLKSGTLLRVRQAAAIARETKLPVLLSGGVVLERFGRTESEAELMAASLRNDFGVEARWLEQGSRNTAENARNSHELLSREKVRRIILVTEAYHMPRALIQFRRQGFSVLPAPTDFIGEGDLDVFSFIPSPEAFRQSYLLVHEWVGYLWYRLRY